MVRKSVQPIEEIVDVAGVAAQQCVVSSISRRVRQGRGRDPSRAPAVDFTAVSCAKLDFRNPELQM